MNRSVKRGFNFGLTSGIITTLGLIVGLNSSTHSSIIIISGILIIAVADAMSDAFGMHISEEAESKHTTKEIWESTFATFFSKFAFALTFIVPILLFTLSTAIIVSVAWGMSLIGLFSFYIAKNENANPYKVVIEHLTIAAFVIVMTHYLGYWVASLA